MKQRFRIDPEAFKDIPRMPELPDPSKLILDSLRATVAELAANPVPADELTDPQRIAMLSMAGLVKFEGGRLKSLFPCSFIDDGSGWYVIAANVNGEYKAGPAPGRNARPATKAAN